MQNDPLFMENVKNSFKKAKKDINHIDNNINKSKKEINVIKEDVSYIKDKLSKILNNLKDLNPKMTIKEKDFSIGNEGVLSKQTNKQTI